MAVSQALTDALAELDQLTGNTGLVIEPSRLGFIRINNAAGSYPFGKHLNLPDLTLKYIQFALTAIKMHPLVGAITRVDLGAMMHHTDYPNHRDDQNRRAFGFPMPPYNVPGSTQRVISQARDIMSGGATGGFKTAVLRRIAYTDAVGKGKRIESSGGVRGWLVIDPRDDPNGLATIDLDTNKRIYLVSTEYRILNPSEAYANEHPLQVPPPPGWISAPKPVVEDIVIHTEESSTDYPRTIGGVKLPTLTDPGDGAHVVNLAVSPVNPDPQPSEHPSPILQVVRAFDRVYPDGSDDQPYCPRCGQPVERATSHQTHVTNRGIFGHFNQDVICDWSGDIYHGWWSLAHRLREQAQRLTTLTGGGEVQVATWDTRPYYQRLPIESVIVPSDRETHDNANRNPNDPPFAMAHPVPSEWFYDLSRATHWVNFSDQATTVRTQIVAQDIRKLVRAVAYAAWFVGDDRDTLHIASWHARGDDADRRFHADDCKCFICDGSTRRHSQN